ncbi:DUF2087 domain-containing protein [Catenuloplanes atrovinosus]|uniref:DUF2087 domain-containing protein n=1 Tax=Catenuloplanes atrovinosus TaxID=137266 RepID=A0AAE3YK55_9ACTN|nr:DUF2087 domain-containing protein [Catenuloplanes atrovinosus]MDR7273781.1 hypothetical protein [Catenuloplanes atrovinosus]
MSDADDAAVRTFVRDGRLTAMPGKLSRRRAVLDHLARASFAPGRRYREPEINDILRAWCDGVPGVDHVAIRRYLIDLDILAREDGLYWRAYEA